MTASKINFLLCITKEIDDKERRRECIFSTEDYNVTLWFLKEDIFLISFRSAAQQSDVRLGEKRFESDMRVSHRLIRKSGRFCKEEEEFSIKFIFLPLFQSSFGCHGWSWRQQQRA